MDRTFVDTSSNQTISGKTFTTLSASTSIAPASDNAVPLGGSSFRFSDTHTMQDTYYGSTSGNIIVKAPAAPTSHTLTLPTSAGTSGYVLQTDGSGTLSWVAQTAGGANTALSNLASVAINTSLLPASDNAINAGSGTQRFITTFTKGVSSTSASSKNLAGTVLFASAGTATITFGTAETDTNYRIVVTGDVNENFWVTSKGTGGFTINSSNGTSTANVDWHLLR